MSNKKALYPLSVSQKMILLAKNMNPSSPVWNIACSIRLGDDIDEILLKKAINEVILRNEGMRLRLKKEIWGTKQYISDFKKIPVRVLDFSDNPTQAPQWLREQVERPFDLFDNNLFDCAIIRFDQHTTGYYLNMDHLISDGWSVYYATQEINRIYEELKSDGITCNYQSSPSYVDYLKKEITYKNSPSYKKNKIYYFDKLKNFNGAVNLLEQNKIFLNSDAAAKTLPVPDDLVKKLRLFCDDSHISLNIVFTTALVIYMSKKMKESDIFVASLFHNRFNSAEEKIIGPIAIFLPLRIFVNKDETPASIVKKINSEIKKGVKYCRDHPDNPALYMLQNLTKIKYILNTIAISHEKYGYENSMEWLYTGHEQVPLTIRIHENAEQQLKLEFSYQSDSFSKEKIDCLYNEFLTILQNILEKPNENISLIDSTVS